MDHLEGAAEAVQGIAFQGASFSDTASPEAEARYRALAAIAASGRAKELEGVFFALEKRAARRQLKWFDPLRPISWFYDIASTYGQSVSRPLLGLVAVLGAFTAAYALVLSMPIRPPIQFDGNTLRVAAEFSLQQLVKPFAVWTSGGLWLVGEAPDHEVTLRWLATLQTVLLGALTYFLALGLRRRFKRS